MLRSAVHLGLGVQDLFRWKQTKPSGRSETAAPPLLSIVVASRRPRLLAGLVEKVATTSSLGNVEIVVRVDDDDADTAGCADQLARARRGSVSVARGPRLDGYYSLNRHYQQALVRSDPNSRLILVLTDEIRFQSAGWDAILARQTRRFADGMFRLRISENRHRTYQTIPPCLFVPENYPVTARGWYEATGGMGEFWGNDSWHQCIAFYLGLIAGPNEPHGIVGRDVALEGIVLSGETVGEGWEGDAARERLARIRAAWARLNERPAHEMFFRLATQVAARIWRHHFGDDCAIHYLPERNVIALRRGDLVLHELSCALSDRAFRQFSSDMRVSDIPSWGG